MSRFGEISEHHAGRDGSSTGSGASALFPGTCLNSCWLWCVHEANDWFTQQKRRPMPRIAADLRAAVFNVHREVVHVTRAPRSREGLR
jgi:hypothetical protein